ncbi:uncharacterized protein LOC143202490 [Rhynchophorus ferrugineus]|uniref:N-acetyltransferase domain-containing protein n=1 Tax=Rhynchophorus ferrugineus TaxID=354439 RepID=A0A834HYC6_RHYFE|nr:hypothetical protein GWI33_017340 [Rhynchophorus ferrugineus]
MSRRLRIEEEKAKQLKDELQEEEDKIKLQQERIFGPLVWRRLQNGIKIQDLQELYFEKAIDLVLSAFVQEDVLFRNTKFKDDSASIKSFTSRLIYKLNDRASIIAIDDDNDGFVAGVLILNPVQKCDFGRVYSRTMLVEGEAYRGITDFMNYINRKVDVFQQCNCDIYLRYYLLCIHPEYRGRRLGYQMMMVGLDIARHLNIPIAMGVFNSYSLQKLARKIGIDQTLFEYQYVKWADRNGGLVFCDPGAGNYTCNVMVGVVPPPPEPEAPPEPEKKEPKGKSTRADKKKAKSKK